jgi:hypothetical protein
MVGLGVLLFQFQNCAKAGVGASDPGASGGTVSLVDGNSRQELQFATTSIQLYDESSTALMNGLCNRSLEGQNMDWTVNVNGQTISSGQSLCSKGQFNFNVDGVASWVCGVAMQVTATIQDGSSAAMFVTKRCQPLASSSLGDSLSDYGQPQTCSLEYTLDGSDQGLCQVACYSQNILSTITNKDASECDSLRQQLSGQ